MMSTFTPKQSITLPLFGPMGGIVLGTSVLSACKAARLTRTLAKAAAKLKRNHQDLVRAMRHHGTEPASPETKEAHRRETSAWTALRFSLKACAAIPDVSHTAKREAARSLEEKIFAKSLSKLPYKMAWAEADERLELIEQEQLAAEIRSLCGTIFLDSIKKAHRATGKALGITEPKKKNTPAERPAVNEALAEFRTALRELVVLIEAHRLAGGAEMADRLLAPLVEWQASRRPRKRAKDSKSAAPTTPPATP